MSIIKKILLYINEILSLSFFKEYFLFDKKLVNDYWYSMSYWHIDVYSIYVLATTKITTLFNINFYSWNPEIQTKWFYKSLPFSQYMYIYINAPFKCMNLLIIFMYIISYGSYIWSIIFGNLFK